ncbi:phage tail tape measure protein [Larkinella sp. VNQ87]|uniref:phage tail tape measure protein n=1 Tax=Larkinella sp. VNQ87 TaxID=3400921 RepID=UPI003C0225C3
MNDFEVSRIKLLIDGDEGDATLKELQEAAAEVNRELRRMKQAGEEGSEAWKELKVLQADLKAEIKEFTSAIDLSDASMRELNVRSRQLNAELRDLKVGSDAWIDKMKEVDQVDTRIRQVKDEMDALRTPIDNSTSAMDRMKEAFAGTFAAFSLENIIEEVISFGRESITSAAQMSDAMSDIAKATDMSQQEVEGLVEAIDQIDTRTATEDLAEIAKVAGQLGIAKNEVLGFVESVDKAVVALGDEFQGGAEEVASTIGGLQKLFKETKDLEAGKAINDIGSALNALGAAGSATAPVVADFTARMGQLGDLSPQINETMGLGAAFQELGLSAEIGAGGLSNILLTAAKDTATFATQLGISEAEMKKLINTNPNQFLLQLAQSLKGLPADEVAKRLADMGIKSQEATKVMSLLKDQTDLVTRYQKLAGDEMKKGTSLTDEFNKKNTNAAAELDKMGKQVKGLSVEFGQALIPIVIRGGQALLTFVNTIRAVPGFINDNKVAFAALAVALVTFNAQAIVAEANSLRLAAAEKGRAIVTGAVTTAQNLLNAAMAMNPIGAVVAAVALLVAGFTLLYNNVQPLRAGIAGVWEALKTGLSLVQQFGNALKNLDFAGAAKIWSTGGAKIAEAYGKGYSDKIKSEQTKIEADHKAHTDRKVATSKTGADKAAQDATAANKTGLAGMTKDNAGYLSDDEKKRRDHEKKLADEKKKANQDAIEATKKANIAAIADEKERKIAQLRFEIDQEKQRIQESQADHKLKLAQFTAADKSYETQKAAIEKEFRDKKAKEDRDAAENQQKLMISLIADEHQRKVAELTFQANQAKAEVERTITDETRKAQALDLINKKLSSDIQKENDEQRQKETQKNQEKREKELAGERQLFDLQFQAAVANADLNLSLAKNNAQAIYQAKLDRLTAEYNFNRQKLQNEAAEEKAKNAELIADHDKRAAADKAIDDRLKAQLTANDNQYEAAKTALTAEKTAQRLANQQQFFSAIDGLMQGDYSKFMDLLNKKLANEQAKNQKALQDFTKHGQDTLQVMGQVVNTLMQLNQKYLESQLKKIDKEKDSQLKSWKEQYDKGVISKDQYEKKVLDITKEADEKTKAEKLKAWKRDQALQITMALINAAQAALKSLATMGWPLGLIGVAASAVAAGIQIAMIKSQKPPSFAKGGKIGPGYFKNAGVLQGGRHGSRPGEAGISMVDRATGMEVGEAEGGEPFMILSRETRKNNGPIIDMLLHSSMHKNGARIFRDGGTYGDYVPKAPTWRKFADGGVSYNADDFLGGGGEGSDEGASYGSDPNGTASGASVSESVGATSEEIAKSQKLMEDIATNTEDMVLALAEMQKYLAGPFTNGLARQSDELQKSVTTNLFLMRLSMNAHHADLVKEISALLDQLIKAEQAGNAMLALTLRQKLGDVAGSIGVSNGYLNRIAQKDLSVQTWVNVNNQINVVAGDSNLK